MKLLGKTRRLHQTDKLLDAGVGHAFLRDSRVAELVENALLHFDGQRYRLIAWCIMPNHVHVVIEPIADHGLGAIVKSWKSFTATQANRILDRTGAFWAPDYFDRFMRDDDQLSATIAYVEANPVAAGLAPDPKAWPFSSAGARVGEVRV